MSAYELYEKYDEPKYFDGVRPIISELVVLNEFQNGRTG